MSELEEKLGKLLSDPNAMQQIMGMAKMLSGNSDAPQPSPAESMPDPRLLQGISRLAAQNGVDSHQDSLLKALHPYLSQNRLTKLERAMRAARMANAASALLGSGGLLNGR